MNERKAIRGVCSLISCPTLPLRSAREQEKQAQAQKRQGFKAIAEKGQERERRKASGP
jgi:hypothetical protein